MPNNIVIAVIGGGFLAKRLISECGVRCRVADNPAFEEIELGDDNQVEIWGMGVEWNIKLR
ncbi:MAG: hypothetical protein ACLQDF_14010 [Desulfomonilia bacterium]